MVSPNAQPPVAVGVDVAKAELIIAELHADGSFGHRRVANTPAAAAAYVEELSARGFAGRMLVESTGHWQWPIVLAAADAGLDVRLINPLQAQARRRGRVRKVKTDRVDAEVLAEMAWMELHLPPPFTRSRASIRLRQQLQLISQLERTIQQLQGTLAAQREACALADVAPAATLAGLEASLAELRHQHRALQREIEALARQLGPDSDIAVWQRLPGISAANAAIMASVLDPAASAKGWVGYIGLDISVRQSGTYKGHGKLTKRGLGYLRKRAYQAGWGAAMNNPAARRYYDALRQQGRAHQEAVVIIARKLVRAAHALTHKPDEPVDPERLFALPT